jgi:hypothetical protein
MSHEDLRARLSQRPFLPFRLVLTEGTAYEVRHPELLMPGKCAAVIGLTSEPAQTLFDSSVLVDLLHLVRLEPLSAAPTTGNGPA